MFNLTIVDRFAPSEAVFDEAEVSVREWIGTSGTVQARAFVGTSWNRIVWDGVATYRFRPHSQIVEVLPAVGVNPARIIDLYRRQVLPVVMQANGWEAIHASAVSTDKGILAFCGGCGAGKSTVAYALSRQGYSLYADDVVVVEPAPGRIYALSLPFKPRLRPQSADFFTNDSTPGHSEPRCDDGRRPLSAVFILETEEHDRSDPDIRRIRSFDALTPLLAHGRRFDETDDAGRKRHLQNYLEIAAVVPVFSVRFARRFDRLDSLLDGLLRAAGVGCPELCDAR
jgi:hypothetical protein